MSSNSGLVAQLDSVAAALKEAGACIEAAKIAAQAAAYQAVLARQPAEQIRERGPEPPENLNKIVSLKEAAQRSSLSLDSLRRFHRDKFVRLSPRRIGMRLRDVLALTVSA
jgi:hypothetical protein